VTKTVTIPADSGNQTYDKKRKSCEQNDNTNASLSPNITNRNSLKEQSDLDSQRSSLDIHNHWDEDSSSQTNCSENQYYDDDSDHGDMYKSEKKAVSVVNSSSESFCQIEYEKREKEQMTAAVADCCLMFGQENPYRQFESISPKFIVEWMDKVLQMLTNSRCAWTHNIMHTFSICIGHYLRKDRKILVDLSFSNNFGESKKFVGNSEELKFVIGFWGGKSDWSLLIIDKNEQKISVIHTGKEYIEEGCLEHAGYVLNCMGWGNKSKIQTIKTGDSLKKKKGLVLL